MNINKYLSLTVLAFSILVSPLLLANNAFGISESKFNEIESRISNMDKNQLLSARTTLIQEQAYLNDSKQNTQSPSQLKDIGERLNEIAAELSSIQKALIAIIGVAAVSALSDDGTYKGFRLEIETKKYTDTVNQNRAVGKNNSGIILIATEYSFASDPNVLINELKFIIDRDDLKAY